MDLELEKGIKSINILLCNNLSVISNIMYETTTLTKISLNKTIFKNLHINDKIFVKLFIDDVSKLLNSSPTLYIYKYSNLIL